MQIVLGKGQQGVSLAVLSKVVEETQGLLQSLGADLGDEGEWMAHNFRDGSVIFDLARATSSEGQAELWRRGLNSVLGRRHEDEEMEVLVSRTTRERFHKVSAIIPESESIEFGVFKNGEADPSEFHVVRHQATVFA